MKEDLRRWITLVEGVNKLPGNQNITVRVFHGSPEPVLKFRKGLFYGVRDYGFAASYALDRARNSDGGDDSYGYVHTLDFHFSKLADDEICDQVAASVGVDISGTNAVSLPDENHNLYEDDFKKVFSRLKNLGYNGITGDDFGFRSDFEQLTVWVVFDASKQITPVSVTPVKDFGDQELNHEPEDS